MTNNYFFWWRKHHGFGRHRPLGFRFTWRRMNDYRKILTTVALAAVLAVPGLAQKTSGSITGQVTDPSGAAVPNADVTLLNKSIGVNRTVHSNRQGEYTFTDVAIGTYEVDVTAPGFRKQVTQKVIVDVDTSTRTDAHLTTGDVSESVTVTSSEIQVQTDSAAVGEIIDGTQVKELPLNGRSFVQLTQLAPGISPANNFDSKNKGLQAGVDFSVNGNPTTNNLFLVDGANDNDVGSNRTILVYPSIDSIAEFKMLTNSYGPEYGQASGAVISIATRSGTNTFHGSAFYGGRNDALAAYTYFSRRNAGKGLTLDGKDKLRRNDWGYSIGGPILKDKLFFFFNEEWNHTISGFTKNACVASAAERTGDFTGPLSCGASAPDFRTAAQKAAPGSVPVRKLTTVDPAGALLAQYYTLPNQAPDVNGNNWSVSLPSFVRYRQENARVDYNVTPRNTVMGRYTQDTWSNPSYNGNQYWGDTDFPVINAGWAQPSKMAIGRWTSTVSSTLINDAEFAYSNNRINLSSGGTNPNLLNQLNSAIPTLYPTSLKTNKAGSTPTIWSGIAPYGSGATIWSIAPWNNTLDIYTFRDDISKVAGKHLLKVGFFGGWDGKNEDTGPASSEHPTLQLFDYAVDTSKANAIATGNPLGNALVPNNPFFLSETSTNVRAQLRWRDYEFYAADTWKITPRVTLNYGFRWSFLRTPYQPDGLETSFQPQLYDKSKPGSDACNGLMTVPGKSPCTDANKSFGTAFSAGVAGPNKYLINQNNHLIAPRVGIAWDVFGDAKTAVRIGAGQFYQRERVGLRYNLVSNAPFAVNASNYSRALGGATPTAITGATTSPTGGADPSNVMPSSFQWNVFVEQSLAKNTAFQIGYVGNRGMHLTSSYDINTIPVNNWLPATFVQGGGTQQYRPFSNFGSLSYFSHGGDASYHSLQTLFRTQVSGLRLQAAYTWAHGISDVLTDDSSGGTGAQSFTYYPNPRLDRGNSATNRPNFFVANATYFLPKLQGRSQLVQQSLGGWELTGITSAASGNSFTVYQNGIGENLGNLQGVSYTIQNGGLQAYTGGSFGSLFQSGLTGNQRPLRATASCTSGSSHELIANSDAFTLVGYHLGTYEPNTAPRGYCHGPKLINTDLSLDKNWRVHDRYTVQLRFDLFDLLNHANFRADQGTQTTNPFQTVNCGAVVGRNATGGALYNPCSPVNNLVTHNDVTTQFGRSNGVNGNAQRQVQYGLHIEF